MSVANGCSDTKAIVLSGKKLRHRLAHGMTALWHRKEKVSKCLAFDCRKLLGKCVKSKLMTQEIGFFGKHLFLTLVIWHFSFKSEIITHISSKLRRTIYIYEDHEIYNIINSSYLVTFSF